MDKHSHVLLVHALRQSRKLDLQQGPTLPEIPELIERHSRIFGLLGGLSKTLWGPIPIHVSLPPMPLRIGSVQFLQYRLRRRTAIP